MPQKINQNKDAISCAFSFSSAQFIPDELLPSRAHFRFNWTKQISIQ